MATAGVIPCPLVQQKPTLSLKVSARVFLYFDSFNVSLSLPNVCALPYIKCVSHSFKIVTLLNR